MTDLRELLGFRFRLSVFIFGLCLLIVLSMIDMSGIDVGIDIMDFKAIT